MADNKFNFTDNRLSKIKPVLSNSRAYFYDAQTPGLRLQVTSNGMLTFQFQARSKQHQKTVTRTIGRYPATSIREAREQAAKLLVEVNSGIDVEESARSIREEETLGTMFERFIEEHSKPHKRTWKEDLSRYRLYIEAPLGNKRISWFTPERVRKWHRQITEQSSQRHDGSISKATANHALKLLSVVFNTMRPGHPNPCSGVKKFRETSRDRFLKPEEIGRFFEALNHPDAPEDFRAYVMLSLFTGARRNNVLAMRWNDIDLKQGVWVVPAEASKNGQAMTVPLVTEAVELLRRRRAKTSSLFVLASPLSKTGHLVEPKRAWKTLLRRAGLQDVKIHDLRRTLGSYMTISGSNTVAVGKALGHKSLQSTAVYARMHTDPVKAGMQTAVALMQRLAEEPGCEVIDLMKAVGRK